jgi:hypothetical protein
VATFCIPRVKIGKLKKIIASLSEKNQLDTLAGLSPEKRIKTFEKQLTKEEASLLNKEFEKAVASEKINSLESWVKNNLDEKYRMGKEGVFKKDFKTIEEADKYIKAQSNLLAEKKLGVALTNKEVAMFSKLGKELFESSGALQDGLIKNEKGMLRFGKALQDIQKYTDTLKPMSKWKAYVLNIGRVNMLASIKTPFLNIESNTINGLTEAITRRVSNWKFLSNVDESVSKQYMRSAKKLYKETGLDLSRMMSIDNPVTGGGKMIGEKSYRTNNWLDSYSDFIFDKTLTGPDVIFGNFAFTDANRIVSSGLAKGNKKLATEIFEDATLLFPKTEQGMIARLESVASARRATYTDDSWSSTFALKAREFLNIVPGLGDITMPFVKTVANVAELGADYAGVGIIKGAKKGYHIGTSLMKGEKVDREAMISAFRDITRAGLGMTTAYAIVSQIDADDFMGAYDPARVGMAQLSNTAYNAISIETPFGKKWVSLDYLGPLAPSVVGMLYAKKYGEDEQRKGVGYLSGVASQYLAQLPMVDPISTISGNVNKFDPEDKRSMLKIFGDTITRSLSDVVVSRIIPGIMYDFARASDEHQRDTRQGKLNFMGVNFDKFAQKIPFLRENLPVKYDALGKLMYEEGMETFLFGARVRTNSEDSIVSEIKRLDKAGEKPNVKDLRFNYSTNVLKLKEKVSQDEFYNIAKSFGDALAKAYGEKMEQTSYKKANDEEKKKLLNSAMEKEYEKMLSTNKIK